MFDFELELNDLDGVPEKYKPLYGREGDEGSFKIDKDLSKKLDVSGLTSALDKERKANTTSTKSLKAFQQYGETPSDVGTKIDELNEELSKGKDGKVNFEKMKMDLEKTHSEKLKTKDEEITQMKGTLNKYLIDSEASKILTQPEVAGSVGLLLPHIQRQTKVIEENGNFHVRVIDQDGDARSNGNGGFMTIGELVSEMKESPDYKRAFDATKQKGNDTPPGGGKPPTPGKTELSATQKIAKGLADRAK